MNEPIISIEKLSKKYYINHQQQAAYSSAREDLVRLVRLPVEIFTGKRQAREEFWALKNISFNIEKGDIVGIIGRNGSGKSTLLKILSQIVEPTDGQATLRGRVASLLEVGTGFHQELTGRENIFLNGAILGMKKKEIQRKFEEIVAFSGVEKFLDTPVKFYSSGMFVRLAFSVAAHLDPDILIVDEVLAVGDSEFQRKSLGKMEEATQEGRTVIFVSHNMGIVKSLCTKGVLLTNGRIEKIGPIDDVIGAYLNASQNSGGRASFRRPAGNEKANIAGISVKTERSGVTDRVSFREPFDIEVAVKAQRSLSAVVGVAIMDNMGQVITTIHTQEPREPQTDEIQKLLKMKAGRNTIHFSFTANELRPGRYHLNTSLFDRKLQKNYDHVEQALSFEVANDGEVELFEDGQEGVFFPDGIERRITTSDR